ncbi:hypothetical protein JXR93_08465 [bacterium]|nr:hypothetical protein [bacterium]
MKFITIFQIVITVFILLGCKTDNPPEISEYKLGLELDETLNISLNWEAITTDPPIQQYEVFKAVGNESDFSKIATIKSDEALKYVDKFTIDGAKYYFYKVRGVNVVAEQPFSNVMRYKATTDIDNDGFIENDCAANINSINPDATESCDGIDNNCNSSVDENIDDVQRGTDEGECVIEIKSCISGRWSIVQDGVFPVAESCDNRDNDCNGDIDDIDDVQTGTDVGECIVEIKSCVEGDWNIIQEGVFPTSEVCDNKDNNCDGDIDEGMDIICESACGFGMSYCVEGDYTICDAPLPQEEICDNIDNNCDGNIDENIYISCNNSCGGGLALCVEGHWLGCDAPQFESTEWYKESPNWLSNYAVSEKISGESLYVFGGVDSLGVFRYDLWEYSSDNGLWRKLPAIGYVPVARVNSSLAYNRDSGDIFLYGGEDESGNLLNDFWVYKRDLGQWQPIFATGDIPSVLKGHQIVLYSGGIYLFGGESDSEFSDKTYLYTVSENRWQIVNTSQRPSGVIDYKRALDIGKRKFYLLGGKNSEGETLKELWEFSFTSSEWSLIGNYPDLELNDSYDILYYNNSIVVFSDNLYKYSFSENSWSLLSSFDYNSAPLIFLGGVDNLLVILFGKNGLNERSETVKKYSLIDNILLDDVTLDSLYGAQISFVISENSYYLFGGFDGDRYLNQLWRYSLNSNHWEKVETTNTPQGRIEHSLTYIEMDNALYLFGGKNSSDSFNTLWRLDLATFEWNQIATQNAPTRFGHTMFYKDDFLYLFGGYEDGIKMDLLKLDLVTKIWSNIEYNGENLPSMRLGYSVVYVPHYRYLLLFGGYAGEYLDDLWLFDFYTNSWISYTIGIVKPSPRGDAKLVYDQIYQNILLIGGKTTNDQLLNDVWTLQLGTSNWKRVSTTIEGEPFINREDFLSMPLYNENSLPFLTIFSGKNSSNTPINNPSYLKLNCEE